ncbi:hypothetical protein GCM10010236_25800 [Streptomyces eurythermus]|nr:hypothetical protein GCM10010236_25800 [Streptomyces eurythermus]
MPPAKGSSPREAARLVGFRPGTHVSSPADHHTEAGDAAEPPARQEDVTPAAPRGPGRDRGTHRRRAAGRLHPRSATQGLVSVCRCGARCRVRFGAAALR